MSYIFHHIRNSTIFPLFFYFPLQSFSSDHCYARYFEKWNWRRNITYYWLHTFCVPSFSAVNKLFTARFTFAWSSYLVLTAKICFWSVLNDFFFHYSYAHLCKKLECGPAKYEVWTAKHKPPCTLNFTGSAGDIEVEATKVIWADRRSSMVSATLSLS